MKGIFEIGPVDRQSDRVLDALGTSWNVLLPLCDGDVDDLQGKRPFDRMLLETRETNPTPKGSFAVWGANHNFYNTEWQSNDSSGCRGRHHTPLFTASEIGGSARRQRETGLHAVMGLFRAHVGKDAQRSFNNAYDPLFAVPEALQSIPRIERAYSDASSSSYVIQLENFRGAPDATEAGLPPVADPPRLRLDRRGNYEAIWWDGSSDTNTFDVPWAPPGHRRRRDDDADVRLPRCPDQRALARGDELLRSPHRSGRRALEPG